MEFFPIRTATLRGDQKIQFDVYVPVADRQIIYLRKGDAFDGVRLQRLKEKKLKKLFIRSEDEPAYLQYIVQNVTTAYDVGSKMPLNERVEIINGAQSAGVESVMEAPGDPKNYEHVKAGASQYVDFLLKEERAVRAMLSGTRADLDIAQHGVAVSTLSVAIARRLGTKFSQIQLLALGGLLHDFGHLESKNPLFTPLEEFDDATRLSYKRHPADGLEAVQFHQHFDPAVVSIIAEHEELIDGSGYPNRLKEAQLDPLSMIVSTANDFDCMMRHQKLSREDALKKFVRLRSQFHPQEHIKALISI
jgi:HD-GYP domain-containing protein (c-di-GMP phosphodiesterase class II)